MWKNYRPSMSIWLNEVAGEYLTPSRFTRGWSLLRQEREKRNRFHRQLPDRKTFARLSSPTELTALLLADHRLPFVQASGVFRGGLLAETPDEKWSHSTDVAPSWLKDSKKRSGDAIAEAIEIGRRRRIGSSIDGTIHLAYPPTRCDLISTSLSNC